MTTSGDNMLEFCFLLIIMINSTLTVASSYDSNLIFWGVKLISLPRFVLYSLTCLDSMELVDILLDPRTISTKLVFMFYKVNWQPS